MAETEPTEPRRERLLTFSLSQLETDSESKQIERANRINEIVKTQEKGRLFKNAADIWRKKDTQNDEETVASRTEIDGVIIRDPSKENAANQTPAPTCCDPVWRCLGGRAIAEARWSLFMIIFDWIVDFAVGIYHLSSGVWPRAVLTYVIVFGGGFLVTFANFSPHELDSSEITAEMWKMSKFYGILMYIPSFYPICTTKLLLHYTKKLASVEGEANRRELTRKHKLVEEKALWDMCCESTFEAIPQAVLQIVLVFDQYTITPRTNTDTETSIVSTVLGFLPILSILLSVYGISMAPIAVIRSRSSADFSLTFGESLAAYSTQALRVLCCSLFIISCRILLNTGNSMLMDTLWSSLSAALIFSIFDVPYIVRHELDKKRSPERSNLATINTVIDTILFITTLGAFQLWIVTWLDLVSANMILFVITVVIYVVLMLSTYAGLFYYRIICLTYRDVAASVIVYAYDATKRWILSVFGILLRRDRSVGPVV